MNKNNIINLTFDEREKMSSSIRQKYADRVPIIILPTKIVMNKYKFLAPNDITIHQLLYSIRKSMVDIKPTEAIFIFINNTIPNGSLLISEIDKEYMDKDGFVYISVSKESTFG